MKHDSNSLPVAKSANDVVIPVITSKPAIAISVVTRRSSECLTWDVLHRVALDPITQTPEEGAHLANCRRCRRTVATLATEDTHLDDRGLLALLRGELSGILTGDGQYRIAVEHLDRCRSCFERCLSPSVLSQITLPVDADEGVTEITDNTRIAVPTAMSIPQGIGAAEAWQEAAYFGDLPARYRLVSGTYEVALSPVAVPYLWLSLCSELEQQGETARQAWLAWAQGYLVAEHEAGRALSAVERLADRIVTKFGSGQIKKNITRPLCLHAPIISVAVP